MSFELCSVVGRLLNLNDWPQWNGTIVTSVHADTCKPSWSRINQHLFILILVHFTLNRPVVCSTPSKIFLGFLIFLLLFMLFVWTCMLYWRYVLQLNFHFVLVPFLHQFKKFGKKKEFLDFSRKFLYWIRHCLLISNIALLNLLFFNI